MKFKSTRQILIDPILKQSLRENYWEVSKSASRAIKLLKPSNRIFIAHVVKDLTCFLFSTVQPIHGQTKERAGAAADWILRAQDATEDDGVSHGYFPCDETNGWRASYPETTGYIIPSLLEFARCYDDDKVRGRALRMAQWEVAIQMKSGAVQGGTVCQKDKQTPVVFNTGMVLDGWSAAYREFRVEQFLKAGRRAADFLISDLSHNGYFKTNGQFVVADKIKTYNCLCAWALYRFGQDVHEKHYQKAAIKIVEAALRQMQPNGWFANNCLSMPEAPLLHTICYTLQGILEVGILTGRLDFINAVQRGTDPIISHISQKGFLPGRFDAQWQPALFSSCLTGSAQFAVVCYKLFEQLKDNKYLSAANRIVNFLKALQILNSDNEAINGGLAGSFPIFGSYMTLGFPNWVTKYFLDGLILQDRLSSELIASDDNISVLANV